MLRSSSGSNKSKERRKHGSLPSRLAKIVVGIVNEKGRILSRLEDPTHSERGYAAALETGKRVCELARNGDTLKRKAVEPETYYLRPGMANLVTMFTPDAIVLSGSAMKNADPFMDGIRRMISEGCAFVPWQKVEMSLASLSDNANLIGAASVWYCRFDRGTR